MTTPITPTPTNSAVTAPSAGEEVTGLSIQATAQQLANRDAYVQSALNTLSGSFSSRLDAQLAALNASIANTGAMVTGGTPGTVTLSLPLDFTCEWDSSAPGPAWALNANFTPLATPWQTSLIKTNASFDLRLPYGVALQSLVVNIRGASGHAALPSNLPSFKVFRTALDHTQIQLISITDSSATVAAYQATHDMPAALMGSPILPGYRYTLVFTGESGTNSVAGSMIYSIAAVLASV